MGLHKKRIENIILQDFNMVKRKSGPQTFSLLKLSLDCSGEFVRLNEW